MVTTKSEVDKFTQNWIRFGFINIAFVAFWGMMMRYNMLHELPFFQQQNLLHAHSHFAFGGWVSHFLYVGLSALILKYIEPNKIKTYNRIIIANLISAYGMLIAFSLQGYKAVSITFSTMSILVAVAFAVIYAKDSKKFPAQYAAKPWILSSIFFNAFSIFGPFSLALLMAKKISTPVYNLSSIYYYLHFQYNGWFFFACMALLIALFNHKIKNFKLYCWILVVCTVITYLLSIIILQVTLPLGVYVLTAIASWLQLIVWGIILVELIKYYQNNHPALSKGILILGAIILTSVSLKFILQAISIFPYFNDLAQHRPFVVAYLHLVLIGIFSIFIFAYSFNQKILVYHFESKFYVAIFAVGFLINEVALVLQGFNWARKMDIPYLNEMLLFASILLLLSASKLFLFSQKREGKLADPIDLPNITS